MSSIRPVTQRFPASQQVWQDSNLPFACVLAPLAEDPALIVPSAAAAAAASSGGDDDDDEHQQQRQHQHPHQQLPVDPPRLTGIAKCLHCGAPHPSRQTHYQPGRGISTLESNQNQSEDMDSMGNSMSMSMNMGRHGHGGTGGGGSSSSSFLLCYLCGRDSSTGIREQKQARAWAEGDAAGGGFDRVPRHVSSQSQSQSQSQSSALTLARTVTSTFSLPLRLKTATLPAYQHQHEQQQQQQQRQQQTPPVVYSVPATTCPVLWFIVLDGSCTDRSYWHAVSAHLMDLVSTGSSSSSSSGIPAHVHVAILMASTTTSTVDRTNSSTSTSTSNHVNHTNTNTNLSEDVASETVLAVYQLASPVPHVLHYTADNDNNNSNINNNNNNTNNDSTHSDDLVEAVLSSLVPADNAHKSHIIAAARSLMDYEPSVSGGVGGGSGSSGVGGSVGGTHHTHAQSGGGTGDAAATSTTITSSLPLGWTVELIVEALEVAAQPVGQRRAADDDSDMNTGGGGGGGGDGTGESSSASAAAAGVPLPYAGGRILVLLADRPTEVLPDTNATGTWRWRRQRQRQRRRREQGSAGASAGPKAVGMGGFGGRIVSEAGKRFDCDGMTTTSATATDDSSMQRTNSTVSGDSASDVEAGGVAMHRSNGKGPKQEQQQQQQRQEESDLTPQHLAQHYRAPVDVEVYFSDLGKQCAEAALGVDILLLVDSSSDDYDDDGGGDGGDIPDFGLPLFSSLADRSGAPGPLLFDLKDPESTERLERELMARTPWQDRQVFGAELRLRMSPGFGVENAPIDALPDQSGGPQLAPIYVQAGLMGPATAVNDSTHLWRMGTCDPFTSFTVDLKLNSKTVQDRFPVDGFGEVTIKPVMQTCFAYTTVVKDVDGQYHTVRQMRISSFPVPLAHSVEMLYSSLDPEALAVVLFHKLALAAFQDGLKESSVIAENWLQSLLVCAYRSAETQDIVQTEQEEKGIAGDAYFLANERLLDREGELSAEEVLLAQGHSRLRTIPLMTYLLVQCDALRQSGGIYQPSMDLRCAALTQMLSMTPTNLTRCIAPRLQLWAAGQADDEEYDEKDDVPILDIIDLRTEAVQLAVMEYGESEDLIVFLDSPDQLVVMDARYVNASASSTADPDLKVSRGLEQTIVEARQSYRTQPSVAYELGQAQTSGERTFLRLLDALIEDAPSPSGHENFYQWRSSVASSVHEELEKA